jgi:glutamate-1-semialdehyde 2,1-aminomutase
MGAMHEFLDQLRTPRLQAIYAGLDACWDSRATLLNKQLADHRLPIRVAHLSSIWTFVYTQPSRYNWMFQYYLRGAGLSLPWVGTGRLIFSLAYSDADFGAVCDRIVAAALAMRRDGWWWKDQALDNAVIRKTIMHELLAQLSRGLRQRAAGMLKAGRVRSVRDAEQNARRATETAARGDTAGYR